MEETYLAYANKVPKENRLAARGLTGQNDLRWAVVVALIEEGDMPFSQLQELLEVHQQRLSNALKGLQQGGVVSKNIGDKLGSQYSGNYQITKFGKKILDGFYEASRAKYENPRSYLGFQSVPNYRGARIEPYIVSDVAEKSKVVSKKNFGGGSPERATRDTYQIDHAEALT